MPIPSHIASLQDTGTRLTTASGQEVEVWTLVPSTDDAVLSEWAAYFRRHYCDDDMLPALVEGTGLSHAEFLVQIKFPDATASPGPSIRAGDFAEIIVADYIEHKLGYWCPRELRFDSKAIRNESSKGCDVIGFRFVAAGQTTPADELFVFESKAALSGAGDGDQLQKAVNDSHKDRLREAMSLSAMKQKFIERGDASSKAKVERFQNENDRPFKRISGAAAVLHEGVYNEATVQETDATTHFNKTNLRLIVIKGADLMTFVHALYERAANEA